DEKRMVSTSRSIRNPNKVIDNIIFSISVYSEKRKRASSFCRQRLSSQIAHSESEPIVLYARFATTAVVPTLRLRSRSVSYRVSYGHTDTYSGMPSLTVPSRIEATNLNRLPFTVKAGFSSAAQPCIYRATAIVLIVHDLAAHWGNSLYVN
ncbi:MAG: hypothetical protein K0R28_7108, partial [Paenibacillus sp.]|nr:hypothetical protein [Paenibacillus sp.]